MIFTGWKMIAGLGHVIHHGPYALMLAILCGALVYEIGIFEGLLIAMAAHGIVHFLVYNKNDKIPGRAIIKRYIDKIKKQSKNATD